MTETHTVKRIARLNQRSNIWRTIILQRKNGTCHPKTKNPRKEILLKHGVPKGFAICRWDSKRALDRKVNDVIGFVVVVIVR